MYSLYLRERIVRLYQSGLQVAIVLVNLLCEFVLRLRSIIELVTLVTFLERAINHNSST